MIESTSNYFEEGGQLSRNLPSFELRPQQLQMAEAVNHALEQGHHMMVEAGTGTGKSLAYLLPAIQWALTNDKKVVISTYTKTLQEQILNHDIPMLRDTLSLPFRYSLCMGNENYLSPAAHEAGRASRPVQQHPGRRTVDGNF